MIDFHCLTKAVRKGGGSTCKADPDILKMRLFASIHRNFFSIERSTLTTNKVLKMQPSIVKRKCAQVRLHMIIMKFIIIQLQLHPNLRKGLSTEEIAKT